MTAKRMLRSIMAVAVLAISLASTGAALAGGACARYITVQWGDTWSSIATMCGTTAGTLQAANPALGSLLYAGQVVYVPTGYASEPPLYSTPVGSVYVVQPGDTLAGIAMLYGVSFSDLLAANPQITNASLIYAGQMLNLPASASLGPASYYPYSYSLFTPTPSAVVSSPYAYLKVTYGHGLLVRTGPGISYSEIKSPFVSAVKFSHWQYRKASVTIDSIGFVWVEVTLSPLVSGYSTGWILVRDSLGKYFTQPNIGPKVDLRDP